MNASKDVITGSSVIGLGGVLLWACQGVKDFAAVGVGAAFLPTIAAWLFIVLGAVMLIVALRTAPPKSRSGLENPAPAATAFGGVSAVLLTFVLMCLYVGLMDMVGFILSSIAYIFLQTLILTKGAPRQFLLFGILAVTTSAATYYLFVKVFQVMIPAGMLG